MLRKNLTPETLVKPDAIYKSRLVTLLINRILQSGKKSIAQKIVYNALDLISLQIDGDPLLILKKAVKNVTPRVEVKARRMGRSTRQIPKNIRTYRGTSISLKWIVKFAGTRAGKSMSIKLSKEILDASKDLGNSIKKKEQTHKMANANRAFAHFKY